jgi:2-alkenal reductase
VHSAAVRYRTSAGMRLVAALACVLLVTTCGPPTGRPPDVAPGSTLAPAQQTATLVNSSPAVRVYQDHGASVVSITSVAVVRTPRGGAHLARGAGSGFVWDADGHVVTNNHVVEQADQLTVTFHNRSSSSATLLGRDEPNDLALLRIDPETSDETGRAVRPQLRPVLLGDSDRVTIGETAIAIGSPLGLKQTVTAGIVSALRPAGEDSGADAVELLGGAIQTDAAINAGNSGGPLFNAVGEIIGVNTAIVSGSGGNIGIGFAIPINVVKRVVPELIQFGCYRHPLLGVTTVPSALFAPQVRAQIGIAASQMGLLVQEVTAGAAAAGIQPGQRTASLNGAPIHVGGDIILAIDGQMVTTGGELRAYIENRKRTGDTVTLDIVRGDQQLQVAVALYERQPQTGCR